jgi:hypothetical protein
VAAQPHGADDGYCPQWRGPGLLWEMEEEFWKFHPPKKPG